MMHRLLRSIFLLLCIFFLPLLAEEDWIDQSAEKTLATWGIPGLSLAIVHQGREIKMQGYGFCERGKANLVDAKTLFQVASLTKAFTALTAAILVGEHKLDWDTPIRTYLPTLCFKDPIASREMNLIDLLSHKTGLPGTCSGEDNEWYKKDHTTEYLMQRLASIDPIFPFRSHFSYSNLAYQAASQVIASVIASPWDLFCKERIFDPLHMERTHFSYELLMEDTNRANPHLPMNQQFSSVPFLNWSQIKASGGMNSCVEDLAKWMQYCLFDIEMGSPIFQPHTLVDGQELVGDENFASTWAIYSHGQDLVHYGLGWMMYKLAGKTVFFHVGLTVGMSSILALVPEEKLGIAILTNQSHHLGDIRLLNQLLDFFVDWYKS